MRGAPAPNSSASHACVPTGCSASAGRLTRCAAGATLVAARAGELPSAVTASGKLARLEGDVLFTMRKCAQTREAQHSLPACRVCTAYSQHRSRVLFDLARAAEASQG